MACKHCHKPKFKMEQGKKYTNQYNEAYILARVASYSFALISLTTGNRFCDPTSTIIGAIGGDDVKNWTEVK